MMIEFKELLERDRKTEHEFPDEKLVSNLRLTSLSHPLREERNSEEFKEQNKWLFSIDDTDGKIPTISFDVLKEYCNIDGKESCDAFFYYFGGEKLSLLIEFKNTSRDKIEKEFLNISHKDCIIDKIKDSSEIITSTLKFEGRHTGIELISNTHIVIVYNGKKNIPTKRVRTPQFGKAEKDKKGKQNKALRSEKKFLEENDRFGKEVTALKFSHCDENYFPIPAKLNSIKTKGIGKIRYYTLFSSHDFTDLVKAGFFSKWDWGEYSSYMNVD